MRASVPRSVLGVCVLLLLMAAVAGAQRYRLAEGPGVPPRYPPPGFQDGRFTACKLRFASDRGEPGGVGWSTDYPFAAVNLMTRLSELTKVRVSRDVSLEINYWVIRLADDALFDCPFLMGSDVGTAVFSDLEVQRLREYLLKGGFLWVDDFWGDEAWAQWAREIHRALPEFAIADVPAADPIRTAMFDVPEVEQVASINFWRRNDSTAERGAESPHADFREIADDKGRILVVMTHNTDIGDSMERESESPDFFAEFSPRGYALATNIVLYALTH